MPIHSTIADIPFRRLPMWGTRLGAFAPTLPVFGRRTHTVSVCAPRALLDPTNALVPTAKGAKWIVGSVLMGSSRPNACLLFAFVVRVA